MKRLMKRLIGPLCVAIVLSVLTILPQQAVAQTADTCQGKPVTIDMASGASGTGTNAADVILGTDGADIIDGLGGNDLICSGSGNDVVSGGEGADTILGEGGNDIVRGGSGADVIHGGPGKDRILGGTGDDEMTGGEGNDFLSGFGGADTIDGGPGSDLIFGGFGSDTINGGSGNDTVIGMIGDDMINGGTGNDILSGDRGNDTINGGPGNDIINGGNANDTLRGGDGDDIVSGGQADDTLSGGDGKDVCIGNRENVGDIADESCETTFGVGPASIPTAVPPAATPTTVPPTAVPPTTVPPAATPTTVPPTAVPAPTTGVPAPTTVAPAPTTVAPAPTTGPTAPNPVLPPATGNYTVAFEEDFRLESSLDRFRWQIHQIVPFNGTPDSWQGDHNLSCAGPTTTRTIHLPPAGTDPGETAYWCAPGGDVNKAHLMTSMNHKGYAQIGFMPDQVFEDLGRVCWDQNQTQVGRKWTQLVIVPQATFAAEGNRLDYVQPRFESGPGAAGVFLTNDVFLFAMSGGSTSVNVGQTVSEDNFRGFSTLDKARRFRTCVEDLENGTVRIELERESSIDVRIMAGSFPDGPARVIFQDDTYNATKRTTPVENAYTWHWDNISIETK